MIDHLVLPVTTLTLARSRLTGLGFTVAADARHPFGTGNCCVFFADRSYLEPITIVDRNVADAAAADGLFFVKRVKRFMQRRGEGFAMVALKSHDIETQQIAYEAAGVSGGPLFRFARIAPQADGTEREIGVALAFAEQQASPDATFFACQHLAADALFQPDGLMHPNGAEGVASVAAVADAPRDFAAFLSAVTGVAAEDDGEGIFAALGQRRVAVLTPAEFRARYGTPSPDPRKGLLFAALEIAVADLDRAIGFAGPTASRHGDLIVVPPSPGLGVVLTFRGAARG